MLYVFYAAIALACVGSVAFSLLARRATEPKARGLHAARTNLCMGALLVLAAAVQFVLFEPDTVRIIVGSLFLLIGIFNLFAGLRNYGYFSRM
ncbi:YtpI family protein [Paenibacillus sp.]|uniref:YtpI family protein n=1 Tax=Paenibacillus sp. TaxID=58172 RepID=UPI002D253BCC|nr:YtpI family protein [Paenibacillus sp.]HZG58451.1 YtpI family protein [Paenibacillus sp.]